MSSSYTQIIAQAIELLRDMPVNEYRQQIKPHFPGSIGAHIRHVIDHFEAIQSGVASGYIDYNKRHRLSEVECCPRSAVNKLESINRWLSSLSCDSRAKTVQVTTEIDIQQTKSAQCDSTLERELIFATSHAIHHYALIKIICGLINQPTPKYFGYAPATITHLNQSA